MAGWESLRRPVPQAQAQGTGRRRAIDGRPQRGPALGLVGMHTAKRQFGESISPFYHVKAGTPPVFIIHGDADKLVPIQQAQVFLERLRAAGGVGMT